jgi:S-adenosylmethionine synthetase
VCAGHPDRLADTIADRIVARHGALQRRPVGVEVALHRNVVFVDGRIAAGRGSLTEATSPKSPTGLRRRLRKNPPAPFSTLTPRHPH